MLSYRHGFHAGNHADVLKHWVEVLCIEYLKRKDKPFVYIDTHAGAGAYSLVGPFAKKTGEAETGIGRLWPNRDKLPEALKTYMQVVADYNGHQLKSYPGSPLFASTLLRADDKLRLVEMHGAELEWLKKSTAADSRIKVFEADGFQQLKALLPPESRRGLVLIDPPYELKSDYQKVIQCINEGLDRFATGLFLVWYPLINSVWAQRYSEQLRKLPCEQWLDVQLRVKAPPEGHGMFGSGLFVINPPWVLKEQLESALPALTELLARDDTAGFQISDEQQDAVVSP